VTLAGGRGELGIGGAVVYDSNAGSEYDECLLKARYYDTARTPIELIETLRYDPNAGLVRSALHLDRLARSANRFGIPFEPMAARALLDERVAGVHGTLRVRLTLDEQGRLSCSATALPDAAQTGWVYAISPVVMVSTDALLRHKTSLRDVHENELKRAQGCDEVLFINELGHLTEGSRTNLFARIDGRLVTPPLDDGVLDGCLRRELLESGLCFEQSLTQADLARANGVFFGNSLRGLIPARHRDMRDATLGPLQAVTA
jgi:para-aminobenzoate synthetase/4-amino-4-deoxychorismate lyase